MKGCILEMERPVYKKVLLKLSGEAISSGSEGILNFEYIKEICKVMRENINDKEMMNINR